MIPIHIELSSESIDMAIRRLHDVQDNLREGIGELINTLTTEGAEQAQAAYGDWPVQAVAEVDEDDNIGYITVAGDMPLIAEFGAGDATLDPSTLFENSPMTPVAPGSYSLLEGSQEYYKTGQWHFGGHLYNEVLPRQGLHMAKVFIIENSTEIAQEVIKL